MTSAMSLIAMIDSPEQVLELMGGYAPTPLGVAPSLAKRAGVAQVMLKDESKRPLGSFKSLGGLFAALRLLARSQSPSAAGLGLVCASDGNHGLSVSAAARIAGVPAHIYLPRSVSPVRAARIEAHGGTVCWIDGSYDDAVAAALAVAKRGESLLVADTTDDEGDPVVDDVMRGYELIGREVLSQLDDKHLAPPTHVFIQAGVGGLAAALARTLHQHLASPGRLVVVEPEAASCVAQALEAGKAFLIEDEAYTRAEMLSCGKASTPALQILMAHAATGITVSEAELREAVAILENHGGPRSTASGAASLAGLLKAAQDPGLRARLQLTETSRVLGIVTEGPPGPP